jgi:hypothetical protein
MAHRELDVLAQGLSIPPIPWFREYPWRVDQMVWAIASR